MPQLDFYNVFFLLVLFTFLMLLAFIIFVISYFIPLILKFKIEYKRFDYYYIFAYKVLGACKYLSNLTETKLVFENFKQ